MNYPDEVAAKHPTALPEGSAIDLQERLREADAGRDKALADYRKLLVECERKSQDDFDKSVMTLSGGALGVSFAFVNTFLENQPAQALWSLGSAWAVWVLSVACVLYSHYMSAGAFHRAIEYCDTGQHRSAVGPENWRDKAVQWLNALAGFAFVVGAAFAGFFVYSNLR